MLHSENCCVHMLHQTKAQHMLHQIKTQQFFYIYSCLNYVLEQDTLSKLSTGSTQEDPSLYNWKIVDGT